MIAINLLNPLTSAPLQSWYFSSEPVVRIGRSKDNEVTVHSAIVSRRHAELRRKNFIWELVNISNNGTYIDNKLIESTLIRENVIIRLSPTGPKLQIQFNADRAKACLRTKQKQRTAKQVAEKAKETIVAYKP
ncbi:MAG: FHA domain-containing protein [Cyanophyceae cyanobacterium]